MPVSPPVYGDRGQLSHTFNTSSTLLCLHSPFPLLFNFPPLSPPDCIYEPVIKTNKRKTSLAKNILPI